MQSLALESDQIDIKSLEHSQKPSLKINNICINYEVISIGGKNHLFSILFFSICFVISKVIVLFISSRFLFVLFFKSSKMKNEAFAPPYSKLKKIVFFLFSYYFKTKRKKQNGMKNDECVYK